jgi:tartrate dehydratase beta subunit/fumarate hydratase class I family protein
MREITTTKKMTVLRSLKVGDPVSLSGVMVTGRDAVHKWMIDTFIKRPATPEGDDLMVYRHSNRCT